MAKRKSWEEKLHIGREPKVVLLERPYAGVAAGRRLLVGTPMLVKEYIEAIPEGQTVSVETMRRDLAAQFDADAMCPTSTGIFVRIVKEVASEDRAAGRPATPVERLASPAKRESRYRAR